MVGFCHGGNLLGNHDDDDDDHDDHNVIDDDHDNNDINDDHHNDHDVNDDHDHDHDSIEVVLKKPNRFSDLFCNLLTLVLGSVRNRNSTGLAFPRNSWHCQCCFNVLTICSANTLKIFDKFSSQ